MRDISIASWRRSQSFCHPTCRMAPRSVVIDFPMLVENANERMLPDNETLCDIWFRTLKLTTPTFGGTVDKKCQ